MKITIIDAPLTPPYLFTVLHDAHVVRTCRRHYAENGDIGVAVAGLPAGQYLVRIERDEKRIATKLVTLENTP